MPAARMLVLAVLSLALPAAAQAAGPGSTLLIDRPTGLGALPFDGANDAPASSKSMLSDDGRYVVFESRADQLLVPGADPTVPHVFVRDRQTKTTTQVDTAQGGAVANAGAREPSINATGTRIAFVSDATNLTADAVTGANVYVKNLSTGAVELASRATGASGAIANSVASPMLDDAGSRVVFLTTTPLDAGNDSGFGNDVYVRDVGTDTTTLESRATGTGAALGAVQEAPAISGNGTLTAFTTNAALEPASDTNNVADVYTRQGTTTTLASRVDGPGTAAGNGRSSSPSLSTTGAVVGFISDASNLVGLDTNVRSDAFTRSGTTTTLQSRENVTNGLGNGSTYAALVSPDGSRIAFDTTSTNLVAGASGQVSTFVRTVVGSTTIGVSRATGAGGSFAEGDIAGLSTGGTQVAFGSDDDVLGGAGDGVDDVFVRDTGLSTTEVASIPTGTTVRGQGVQDSDTSERAVSDDGRFIVFRSGSDGLGFASPYNHVFVRDTLTNTTTRVDGGAPNGYSYDAVISGDGSTVAYTAAPFAGRRGFSSATNVYAYTLATGATTTVGVRPDGTIADAAVFGPSINRDGTKIAFSTWATNLDPVSDGDSAEDVYVRDLGANTTTLVSRGDGAGTPNGTNQSTGASIDSDGRRIAFRSDAPGLASGDANTNSDVYVRDVVANTTTLVSRPSGAGTAAGNDASYNPSISGDGTKVAFESQATNLGDGSDPDTDVYLRDLGASTTTLLSRVGASGPSTTTSADLLDLSRDGSTVAYATSSANVLGESHVGTLVVVRRIADGTSVIGSRADGASDALPTAAYAAALNADGACLAFVAQGTGLVPGGYGSPDYSHVYERALGGDCPRPAPSAPPAGGAPNPPKAVGPLPTPVDRTAPVISGATLSPTTFAVAPASARAAAKTKKKKVARGTKLRFRLSEAASVVLSAARKEQGRRSGKRCVKSTAKLRKRKAKKCTRYVAKGTVKVTGKAGANTVAFSGRINRRAIPRGSYRLGIDATDAARNKARTKTLTFKVVKG